MALWQYDIHLLPKQRVHQLLGSIPHQLDRETLDSANWWNSVATVEDCESTLSRFTQRRQTWDSTLSAWGSEDGNRIDLYLVDGAVAECFARLDVRSFDEDFLEGVLGFARRFDCLLVTPRLTLINPTQEALWQELRRSDAWRYVEDPESFLRSLHKES
jgi:hypothetical protein